MQQRRATASIFFATLMALTLLGCTGAEQKKREQAAAAQRQLRALVSRCRGQQPAVQRHLQELQRSSSELANLKQQAYSPLRRPAAPDPELMARFTREDQELELERYEQALAAWRSSDRAERRDWQEEQEAKRQRSTARQQQSEKALLALGVGSSEAARNAWRNCEPQQLAAVSLR
ncbi:hypothetical protein KQ298_10545 [Synechococcus sp. CS-1330]|nr:hypothetical protein [Synechococcus sp. CS-1330]